MHVCMRARARGVCVCVCYYTIIQGRLKVPERSNISRKLSFTKKMFYIKGFELQKLYLLMNLGYSFGVLFWALLSPRQFF